MEPLALESRYPSRAPARGILGGPPAVAAPGPERYLAERPAIAQVVWEQCSPLAVPTYTEYRAVNYTEEATQSHTNPAASTGVHGQAEELYEADQDVKSAHGQSCPLGLDNVSLVVSV